MSGAPAKARPLWRRFGSPTLAMPCWLALFAVGLAVCLDLISCVSFLLLVLVLVSAFNPKLEQLIGALN